MIAGTSNGTLVVWEEGKFAEEIQAHSGKVQSLCACPEGFVSGCDEGLLILWSLRDANGGRQASLQKITVFDIANACLQPAICSIDITPHLSGHSTTMFLVRTQGGTILEVSGTTGTISKLLNCVDGDLHPQGPPRFDDYNE